MVENAVGNGEIACFSAFFPFLTVFSEDWYCRHVVTLGLVWKKVNMTLRETAFQNNVGKKQILSL